MKYKLTTITFIDGESACGPSDSVDTAEFNDLESLKAYVHLEIHRIIKHEMMQFGDHKTCRGEIVKDIYDVIMHDRKITNSQDDKIRVVHYEDYISYRSWGYYHDK